MFVACCVLSGRDICDELITRPEESYRLWCVVVCDLETKKILVNAEEAKVQYGAIAPQKRVHISVVVQPTYPNPCGLKKKNFLGNPVYPLTPD